MTFRYGPGNGLLDEILGRKPSSALGNPLAEGTPQGLLGSNPFGSGAQEGMLGPAPVTGGLLDDPRVGYGQMLQRPDAIAARPTLQTKVGGVTDRILGGGGVDMAAMGAGPEVLKDARRAGLLNFGLTLMGAGQKGGPRRRLGESLAQAMQAGQQGYAGTVETAGKVAGLEKAKEMEAKKKAIYDKYAGKITDPEALGQMMGELAAIGDTAGLGPLSNVYNAMAAANAAAGKSKLHWTADENGGWLLGTDENDGTLKAKIPIGIKPREGGGFAQARLDAAERRSRNATASRIQGAFVNAVRDDTAAMKKAQPVIGPLNALFANAKPGEDVKVNGAQQIGLLFNFIMSLDDTAVRDGERQLGIDASGWRDKVKLWKDSVAKGEPAVIPPGMIKDMLDMANLRVDSTRERIRLAQESHRAMFRDQLEEDPNEAAYFNVGNLLDEVGESAQGGGGGAQGGGSGFEAGMEVPPAAAAGPSGAQRLQTLMTPQPAVTPPPPGLNRLFNVPLPRSDTYPIPRR